MASLRTALEKERQQLMSRLEKIDEALGRVSAATGGTTRRRVRAANAKRGKTSARRRGKRPANAMSLREGISKAVARAPLSVRDIVDAVQKLGYRFQASNPVNSVGAYLYGPGKKHFKRVDGKFTVK